MGAAPKQLPPIRNATAADRDAISDFLLREWRTTRMISRGVEHNLLDLPALVAYQGTDLIGLATLAFDHANSSCELVTLNATEPRQGLGSALLHACADQARANGASRLWLITTNDNLDAIRFYQRRGMRLVAAYPGAVDEARKLKPQIPLTGNYGIPLRDEIEFALTLD